MQMGEDIKREASLVAAPYGQWVLLCPTDGSSRPSARYKVIIETLTVGESRVKEDGLRLPKIHQNLLELDRCALEIIVFSLVPPYQIAHGLIAFICSLVFISGIAYGVTKLTDQISSVIGVSPYVVAFIVLAAGKRATQITRPHAKYQTTNHTQYDAATRHLFSPCIQYQHPTLQPGSNIRCLL